MLYIEDSDDDLWLDLVELLCERQVHDMVLCLYPGSAPADFPEPFPAPSGSEPLEYVFAHPDGSEPPCSARVQASGEAVDLLRPHTGEFEDWGDSLALYPPRERQWVAAFIPDQRVALVRDVRLKGFLDAAGIKASEEPPSGLEPSLINAAE